MRTSDILLLGGFLPFLLKESGSGSPNRVGRFRVNFNLNLSVEKEFTGVMNVWPATLFQD